MEIVSRDWGEEDKRVQKDDEELKRWQGMALFDLELFLGLVNMTNRPNDPRVIM
jgi:hypothetical protein